MKKDDIIKIITYSAFLGVICIVSFLAAKYVIRSGIKKNEIPVDTSVRLN